MQQKAAKCMFKPSETLTALNGKSCCFFFQCSCCKNGSQLLAVKHNVVADVFPPPPPGKKKTCLHFIGQTSSFVFSGNSRPGGNSHRACSLSFSSLLTFFRCCLFLPLHYTLSLGCHEVISECTVTGNKCVFVCVWCEIHVM